MLTRKLSAGLITVILGIWFASWRGHTPNLSDFERGDSDQRESYRQLVRANLTTHLKSHHHFIIEENQVQLIELESELLSLGQPFFVFFSAKREESPNLLSDIYMMQARMGSNALPISFTPPRNLTENPESDDHLFEVDERINVSDQVARVLYGQRTSRGECRTITYLNWGAKGGQNSSWVSRLKEAHYYDRWETPQWITLRFQTPLPSCEARFGDSQVIVNGESLSRGRNQFVVTSGGTLISRVDVATETMKPSDQGMELVHAPADIPHLVENFQQTLRTYDLLTQDEDLSLRQLRAGIYNTFERNIYEFLVDKTNPRIHLPVGEVSSILDSRNPKWYPPRIDIKSNRKDFPNGFPGEGVWRPMKIGKEKIPYILKTFIRLDPQHPYHAIHLYAFDMRRLGLHFVGGGDPKQRILEGVGSGQVPSHHVTKLIAAFNGGPNPNFGHGIVQDHQILTPLEQGLPTIAMDHRGRATMGRLDVDNLPEQWSSARQSFAPLIDLRVTSTTFIPPQSPKGRLDQAHITRSALGVNSQGTLIYAWSESTTISYLRKAMRLVGVRFAMTLNTDAAQLGAAIYPEASQGEDRPFHQKMNVDPKVWRNGSEQDFFYLVLAQSLPKKFPTREPHWAINEGIWKPVRHQNIDPWMATSYISAKRAGSMVELALLDGERLHLHLALGEGRDQIYGQSERPLPEDPASRIPFGVGQLTSGLIYRGQTINQALIGEMTWAVDDQGRSVIGRWGQGDLTADYSWDDLIQGMGLIEGGKKLEIFSPPTGTPLTAIGITPSRDLVIASSLIGDLSALATSLELAGVNHGLLLTEKSTSSAGHLQFFYKIQGQTFYNTYPDFALRPALLQSRRSALLGVDDAFLVTPKRTNSRARFINSFKELLE